MRPGPGPKRERAYDVGGCVHIQSVLFLSLLFIMSDSEISSNDSPQRSDISSDGDASDSQDYLVVGASYAPYQGEPLAKKTHIALVTSRSTKRETKMAYCHLFWNNVLKAKFQLTTGKEL